jgi:tetratricopeptide (TPR) repeat protein
MLQLRQYEDALIAYKKAASLENGPHSLSSLGASYAHLKDHDKAMEIIEELKKIEGIEQSGNYYIGWVYEALGEWDSAFEYYNKAIENREGMMLWIKYNSSPEMLEDPRAVEMIEKMGVIY